jgi:hypothetical protein
VELTCAPPRHALRPPLQVSDFGLARPMGPNSEVDTIVKHLPVRWIPPEVRAGPC